MAASILQSSSKNVQRNVLCFSIRALGQIRPCITEVRLPQSKTCLFYSTTSDGQQQPESEGAFAKLKTMVKAFMNGSKFLIKDVKEMRDISKRLKDFLPLTSEKLNSLANGTTQAPVTAQEFAFVVNTRKDLRRVLPALVLFWIPFVGYFAPVIAFMFPQYFLSSHFLTDSQRVDLLAHRLTARREKLTELANLVGDKLGQVEDVDTFVQVCQTDLAVSALSRKHLILLRDVWGWSSWIPPIFPRKKLQKEILDVFTVDLFLRSQTEGIEKLKDIELNEYCLARCMLETASHEDRKSLALKWSEASAGLSNMQSKDAISSVICHLPLLVNKTEDSSSTSGKTVSTETVE